MGWNDMALIIWVTLMAQYSREKWFYELSKLENGQYQCQHQCSRHIRWYKSYGSCDNNEMQNSLHTLILRACLKLLAKTTYVLSPSEGVMIGKLKSLPALILWACPMSGMFAFLTGYFYNWYFLCFKNSSLEGHTGRCINNCSIK